MVVLELSKLLKNYLKRRKWRHGEALQFLQFVRSLRLGQRSFDSQTHAFTYFPVSSSTVTLTVETSSHCKWAYHLKWPLLKFQPSLFFLFWLPNFFSLQPLRIKLQNIWQSCSKKGCSYSTIILLWGHSMV